MKHAIIPGHCFVKIQIIEGPSLSALAQSIICDIMPIHQIRIAECPAVYLDAYFYDVGRMGTTNETLFNADSGGDRLIKIAIHPKGGGSMVMDCIHYHGHYNARLQQGPLYLMTQEEAVPLLL